ncbi:MAG: hypothetical protein ILP18_01220 [Treponema sp.]|nr:hypothetical protein [Treponema sp.]
MSDEAFAELTKKAVALPYAQQWELLNMLTTSVQKAEMERPRGKRFTEEEIREVLDSVRGVSHCWDGEDALDYQRRMREERDIV